MEAKGNLWELALSPPQGPRNRTQVVMVGGKPVYLLHRLTGPSVYLHCSDRLRWHKPGSKKHVRKHYWDSFPSNVINIFALLVEGKTNAALPSSSRREVGPFHL